jgi:hypothetical protein
MKERGAASIDSPNLGYSAHSHPPGGLQNYYRQNVIGGLMPLCWSNGRKPMRPSLDASFLVLFSFAGELRAADVDLEVILSADVSRSIDDAEFKLQRKGYAAALSDPRVLNAIHGRPRGSIGVCYIEWSGGEQQVDHPHNIRYSKPHI